MVRAVLAIVFRNDDQRVGSVLAMRDCLNEQSDRIVVIRLLSLRGVHSTQRRAEGSRVIVAQAYQREVGQVLVGNELIKLALPFVVPPVVRIVLIVTTEVHIGQRGQGWSQWSDLDDLGAKRIAHRRGLGSDAANVVRE